MADRAADSSANFSQFLELIECTDDCGEPLAVQGGWFVRPNVRAKRAPTAGRQARAGENVQRTTGSGLVACRWRSA